MAGPLGVSSRPRLLMLRTHPRPMPRGTLQLTSLDSLITIQAQRPSKPPLNVPAHCVHNPPQNPGPRPVWDL